MTYADKVLLNTAMSASHRQNIHIMNAVREVSKRIAAKSREILKDDQKLRPPQSSPGQASEMHLLAGKLTQWGAPQPSS